MYSVGFSGYVHVDFDRIIRSSRSHMEIVTPDGKTINIPRKQVANHRDYRSGDRDGCVSIREACAARKGLI